MFIRAVLLGVLWCGLCTASVLVGNNTEGFVIRLKPEFLRVLSDHWVKHYMSNFFKWTVGEMNYLQSCKFGSCFLLNFEVSHFVAPLSNVTFKPGVGIKWTLMDAEFIFSFEFLLDSTSLNETTGIKQLEGFGTVHLKGVSLSAEIELGRDANETLLVTPTNCSMEVSEIKTDISLTTTSGYRGSSNGIQTEIRDYFQGRLHESVRDVWCKYVNLYSRFPDAINIRNSYLAHAGLYFSMSVPRDIILKPDSIEIPFRGELQTVEGGGVPFQPSSWYLPPKDSNMAAFYMSENFINSVLYTHFKKGLISAIVTKPMFPLPWFYSNYFNIFNTGSDDRFCFKNVFPNISDKYPNSIVKFSINATSAPLVNFSKEAMEVRGVFDVTILIPGKYGSDVKVATLHMIVHKSANVRFITFNDRVQFIIANPTITIIDNGSPKEFLSYVPRLNDFLGVIDYSVDTPWLNVIGGLGFPLDLVFPRELRLFNFDIAFVKGAFRIGTDIVYQPSSQKNTYETAWELISRIYREQMSRSQPAMGGFNQPTFPSSNQ